jgi:hypothetical protein
LETPIAVAIGAAGGAAVSAVVSGIYNLLTKRAEYANDYYKLVLTKRLAAYEQLEKLIVALKTTVLDTDNRPYHWLFAQDNELKDAYVILMGINAQAMWLSEDAYQKARELNLRIFRIRKEEEESAIEFGKKNYPDIATLREELEKVISKDMGNLHKVKRFLRQKAKRKAAGFVAMSAGSDGLQEVKKRGR